MRHPTPLPTAEGCAYCGKARHGHVQEWSSLMGWHGYILPSKTQIAARMRLRFRLKGWLP